MRRIVQLLLVSVFSVSCVATALCQNEDAKKVTTIEGQIAGVDWVASTVVIRWLDSTTGYGPDELLLNVAQDTKITKGTDTISLADLNVGDEVTVRYCDCSLAGLKAVSIVVKSY